MKRLLIDSSHILKACLHSAGSGPGATVVDGAILPAAEDGYENWLGSLTKTLNTLNMVPAQIIFIKDGKNSKQLRRQFLPNYKTRPAGVPGFHDEFLKLQDLAEENLLSYGAVSVCKDGCEADDLLWALGDCLDSIIWSGDGDMLGTTTDVFYQGQINDPMKFMGIAKKHIVVYKSLVGDVGDTIPGAKGLGEGAFRDMLIKYNSECLDEFLEMLENRTLQDLAPFVDEFKPFKKILDNEETVYNSYLCAKFHHPGWDGIEWRARYPKGDGTWKNWDLKVELITKDKLTTAFIQKFKQQLAAVPWGPSFDIETWSDEESLAWGLANKSQKGPRLDVYGAHMAGFSITTGPNNNIVYYFPNDHADTNNLTLNDMKMLLDCCDESKPMFVFNAEFELPVVRNHMELRFDRGWLPNVLDVLIMKSEVNENTPLKLKTSSWEYLKYKQVTFEEVTEEKPAWDGGDDEGEEEVVDDYEPPPRRQMTTMTGEEVVDYGADDSICTGALANLFEIIMRYEGTWDSFIQCEPEPAYLCAESFLNGQQLDYDMLEKLTEDNARQTAELWEKVNVKLVDLEWTVGDELSGAFYTEKLPGCVFLPALDLSGSELKKVYKQVTGEALKSNLRSVEKLAGLMALKAPELSEALTLDDDELELENSAALQLERFNTAGEKLFVPAPELNLGSPKQMQRLLYEAMGFPVRLRGKITDKMRAKGQRQGNPKGNELAIRHAIMHDATEEQKELLLLLIKTKQLQTDASLYLKPYARMKNPKSGLIHGSFGQSRQKTRRFSSSNPNRTQLSNKSPIRKVYIPMVENHVIVAFDEAGQELRHGAWHSQDQAMLSCFIGDNKKDIHSITATAIMIKRGEDITYEDFLWLKKKDDEDGCIKVVRKQGKESNFLGMYLGTAKTLAEKLLVPESEAQDIDDARNSAFPEYSSWQTKIVETCRETGYAMTPLGARKHIPLDGSWKDEHNLRSALNSIIQGGAAEQIKLIMAKVWRDKITDVFDCVYLFPCHDEHVFSVHIDQVVDFCKVIHPIMTAPYGGMDMPWESSIEIGWNYGEMKEFSGLEIEKIEEHLKELKKQKEN